MHQCRCGYPWRIVESDADGVPAIGTAGDVRSDVIPFHDRGDRGADFDTDWTGRNDVSLGHRRAADPRIGGVIVDVNATTAVAPRCHTIRADADEVAGDVGLRGAADFDSHSRGIKQITVGRHHVGARTRR